MKFRILQTALLFSIAAAAQTATTAKPAAKPFTAAARSAATGQASTLPKAVLDTSMGTITCTLFPDAAPKTVANFIGLATGAKQSRNPKTGQTEKKPYYDRTTFHRVIPNFMVQGGDPLGNGTGDPGFRFNDEFVPHLKFDVPGRLAMANSGPNTNGSQFFITEVPNDFLDPCLAPGGCMRRGRPVPQGYGYTIFGQCDNTELVSQIARVPRDPRNDKPLEPVVLKKVTIIQPAGAKKTTPRRSARPRTGTTRKPSAPTTQSGTKKPQ